MTQSIQTAPVALITGGGRGLGRAAALHLARCGHGIVLTYVADQAAAEETVAEIAALGGRAVALRQNAADTAAIPDFVATLRSTLAGQFGTDRLAALVNNAGIGITAPIDQTTEAQFDRLFALHVRGVFFLTQALLPVIADGGRIVNLSSGLARFSLPGHAAYAMAKGAIEVFTRYLARELGPRRISVNTIAPGAVETDFGGGSVRDNPAVNTFVASVTAMGRPGLPDDVGGAIAALVTGGTGWVTGQRIEVSGGMFV
jgi:NAD(P)-dependent dehydrogenase (short-subunit alcohol dehydrogenase family)